MAFRRKRMTPMKRTTRRQVLGRAWSAGVLLTLLAARLFASEGKAMRVELDVYSGRPNPSWELSEKQGEEFIKRLRALPKADSGSVRDGLGYRGLIVDGLDESVAGFRRVVLSSGVVLGRGAGRDKAFRDKDRDLEHWLLSTGKGRIDAQLFDEIQKEIKPPG